MKPSSSICRVVAPEDVSVGDVHQGDGRVRDVDCSGQLDGRARSPPASRAGRLRSPAMAPRWIGRHDLTTTVGPNGALSRRSRRRSAAARSPMRSATSTCHEAASASAPASRAPAGQVPRRAVDDRAARRDPCSLGRRELPEYVELRRRLRPAWRGRPPPMPPSPGGGATGSTRGSVRRTPGRSRRHRTSLACSAASDRVAPRALGSDPQLAGRGPNTPAPPCR